jgi:hypothetical protein
MLSYNHAPYLPAAIESVLGQTIDDVELVIAEDGSTDGSLAIAKRYAREDARVRVVTHPGHVNRGIGPTVDLVRSMTKGRYQLGLPSDDLLYPHTLETEVEFLESHPDVGYVYGYGHLIDGAGRLLEVNGPDGPEPRLFGQDLTEGGRTLERLVQGNAIPAMTALWRRECLDETGDEHPTLVYGDWEHEARAAARWEVGFIPRPLAAHRLHGRNTSIDAPRELRIARQLAVTSELRERAVEVGGRLAEPRIRAALELQVGYLRFASGDGGTAEDLRAAFTRDPSLAGDARWLADWLWARPLDELLAEDGPEFVRWFGANVKPLLETRAASVIDRDIEATRAESRAIRHARAGRPGRACLAALVAFGLRPQRRRDPVFRGVLLDSLVGVPAGRAMRSGKRRVQRVLRTRGA